MKKRVFAIIMTLLIVTVFATSCTGDKAIDGITVIEGLKTEYKLNETPDFSSLKVRVSYNDGTSVELGAADLEISSLDTSVKGDKILTISYEGYSLSVAISVVSQNGAQPTDYFIASTSLPDSLALWEMSKSDFINPLYSYTIGDDNAFVFTPSRPT